MTDTPEWKVEMVVRGGVSQFSGAAAMIKRIDDEYHEVKALLVELALAKQ